ncbi:hypothetical protein B9Z55_021666 [Caenorhabditis nigoni]|uniref:Uncharacterized protein n=1 Tax=Caenorhabditis nigoni TaxID=1611254 RepID=A0A2G5TSY5_9PELO|nr:hypothetical protein B9Z55_021666 [Caenorhabditis nigoni]
MRKLERNDLPSNYSNYINIAVIGAVATFCIWRKIKEMGYLQKIKNLEEMIAESTLMKNFRRDQEAKNQAAIISEQENLIKTLLEKLDDLQKEENDGPSTSTNFSENGKNRQF